MAEAVARACSVLLGHESTATTPWGSAIDYAVPQVREFAIENALYWISNYRFDGLRLDAVHAIVKPGTPSVLVNLSRAVGVFAEAARRRGVGAHRQSVGRPCLSTARRFWRTDLGRCAPRQIAALERLLVVEEGLMPLPVAK